jgi:antitoxin ParD1/3/4
MMEALMGKNTSVVQGAAQEPFLREQIVKGRFATKSEALRESLGLLEQRELRLDALRRAIDDGSASGDYQEINIEDYFVDAAA